MNEPKDEKRKCPTCGKPVNLLPGRYICEACGTELLPLSDKVRIERARAERRRK